MKELERKNENHKEIFKFEQDQAETDAAMDKAYEHLVKEVNIDGFRKGKAPRTVVESHVGKDAMFDHAMHDALPDLIGKILEENQVKAYATPQVKVVSSEPVVVEATVPLPPDITLGDYNAIKMKPNPVAIEDKAVDAVLERAQHQVATWEEVTTPVELNDGVLMDVESDIDGLPYVIEKGANLQLLPNMRFPAQGFSEAIVGMTSGEEREFNIKIPEDSSDKARAGKEVHFKVKLNNARREKLPELNDDFAKKMVSSCETMEKLREQIKSDLGKRAQAKRMRPSNKRSSMIWSARAR
jgi:trigger factor